MKSLKGETDLWQTLVRIAVASIWIDAGVFNKLLNPGFLNPGSTAYIGFTLQYLAEGSPIRAFLYSVVFPHPQLVGILVMIGEISFGVLTLLGFMSRLAGTVAFYTNLIYFLSAYWTGTEEYGINLLLMLFNLYLVAKGPGYLSVDQLIQRKLRIVERPLPWLVLGSLVYLIVIFILLIY
ncbi:DoxX family membrane protein [Metallosphaera tengchongensis]|uniref:DoxX family membrane protein n=1 Tax=Metallosphaera tengchongensis TaxID=1532350 RepID=A0A6N0NTY2_9CREN|nr:TQO small subunit DoxD [Metallosphaera tengchongensis]QKR00162.1 DoxX family membrane protein [Metallosphaera tengchongensis]